MEIFAVVATIQSLGLKDNQLQFDFHKMRFPMTRFHYDRFDTPDDEIDGKWSVNFRTNPQGDIDQVVMSFGEAYSSGSPRPSIRSCCRRCRELMKLPAA